MPDIRFVPECGGYAVHTSGCRHNVPVPPHHAYGFPRLLCFTQRNLVNAVTELYRSAPVAELFPQRFTVQDCAWHVPLTGLSGSWEEHHDVLVGHAAHSLWVLYSGSVGMAKIKLNALLEDVRELERPDAGTCQAQTCTVLLGHREQIAATHAMRLWKAVCANDQEPQESDTATCRRFVMRAEAALRDAMERLVLEEGQSRDPLEQGIREAERTGTRLFVKAARSCLAKVHAHRALRDGCVRPDQ